MSAVIAGIAVGGTAVKILTSPPAVALEGQALRLIFQGLRLLLRDVVGLIRKKPAGTPPASTTDVTG